MMRLAELQDQFQRALIEGETDVLSEIVDSPKERRDVLLGVYQNAYTQRLVEFLVHDYQQLHAYLGSEPFARMARAYIAEYPSRTPNARWYGAQLPWFLTLAAPYRGTPVLAELAGLERALNDVFDAGDAELLTLDDLAGVAPEEWAALTFKAIPATRRLDLKTNAAEIWRALRDGERPPEPTCLAEVGQLIVYRTTGQAMYRAMPSDEAMIWDEASKGARFGVLCEMLAAFSGSDTAPARAAQYLKGWIEAGLLVRI